MVSYMYIPSSLEGSSAVVSMLSLPCTALSHKRNAGIGTIISSQKVCISVQHCVPYACACNLFRGGFVRSVHWSSIALCNSMIETR